MKIALLRSRICCVCLSLLLFAAAARGCGRRAQSRRRRRSPARTSSRRRPGMEILQAGRQCVRRGGRGERRARGRRAEQLGPRRRRLLAAASRVGWFRDDGRCARSRADARRRATCSSTSRATSFAGRSTQTALAAGIPGEAAGLAHLATKYGRLPLKTSMQPAIRLAREGFPLNARLRGGIEAKRNLFNAGAAAKIFLREGRSAGASARSSSSRSWRRR